MSSPKRSEVMAAEKAVKEALDHVTRLIDYGATTYTVVTATEHLNDVVGLWAEAKDEAS